jgi:scyllo-inositol 2-dehydrogenase (NADP+)
MAKSSSAPVSTAVIGLGRAGWDIHIRQIRGRKDFVLTEVMDINKARLKEAQDEFGCRTFSDYKKFLRESEAELVVVASQSMDHARMAWESLLAGHNVLCEKPMATRFSDIDKMIAAEKKSGKKLAIHQNARVAPDLLHIKEQLRRGVLGRIFAVKRASSAFSRRNDWQTLHKYGGGQLNNNGVHLIDQVLQILDSPAVAVFGDLQQILNPGDVEDHVKVVFRTESGATGDVELAVSALPLPTWVVMGDRGTLTSDGETSRLRYLEGEKKLPALKPVDASEAPGRRYGTTPPEKLTLVEETLPSVPAKKLNFYDLLYETLRKDKRLVATVESARRTMQVLQMARKGTPFA